MKGYSKNVTELHTRKDSVRVFVARRMLMVRMKGFLFYMLVYKWRRGFETRYFSLDKLGMSAG
jgi:hypothetical protein